MLRNLILLMLLSFFSTACISSQTHRNIANISSHQKNDEMIYLDGLNTYFPLTKNNQDILLVNKYNVAIKYKIVTLGNILLVKNKGTCSVSGKDDKFYTLSGQSSCSFNIVKVKVNKNANEGEIRIYKKSDNKQELIISEMVNLNTFSEGQCQVLISNAYRSQEPDTLHTHQYNNVNGKYIFKPSFITECRILEASNINDHNKISLFKYCIDNYDPDKRKKFINYPENEIDEKSYHDHLSELSEFDSEDYCQDIEE